MNAYINSILVIVAMATLYSTEVEGQSYHFSNGWQPGGKRSSIMEVCHFRSEVKALIYKLIEVSFFKDIFKDILKIFLFKIFEMFKIQDRTNKKFG